MSGDHQETEKEVEKVRKREKEKAGESESFGWKGDQSQSLPPAISCDPYFLFFRALPNLSRFLSIYLSLSLSYWEILSNFHEDQNGDRDQQQLMKSVPLIGIRKGVDFCFNFSYNESLSR